MALPPRGFYSFFQPASVVCPAGTVAKINVAKYGMPYRTDVKCPWHDATAAVGTLINGKQTATIPTGDDAVRLFAGGVDPCPYVSKAVAGNYSCVAP